MVSDDDLTVEQRVAALTEWAFTDGTFDPLQATTAAEFIVRIVREAVATELDAEADTIYGDDAQLAVFGDGIKHAAGVIREPTRGGTP